MHQGLWGGTPVSQRIRSNVRQGTEVVNICVALTAIAVPSVSSLVTARLRFVPEPLKPLRTLKPNQP